MDGATLSLKNRDFHKWLEPERSGETPYWHLRLREVPGKRQAGLAALQALVKKAHQGALHRLQEAVGTSLDPMATSANEGVPAPGSNYPHDLHTTTLQGYMGEIVAGLIAENFEPLEREWDVPAFTFRGHDQAIHHLEERRLLGVAAHPIPGKSGNDCLAFQKEDDQIIAFLTCEAKCTHDHRSALITEGHEQLSANNTRIPVDLIQLIEILRSMDEQQWADALSALLITAAEESPEHCDLFVYVCGRGRKNGEPWMNSKNENYRAKRELEAAELPLSEFDRVLEAAYPGHILSRPSAP